MWKSEQKLLTLIYRNSNIFYYFQSQQGKFLNVEIPTLRLDEATLFQLQLEEDGTFSLLWNGTYVSVNEMSGVLHFTTTDTTDVYWNGTHLISKKYNKALDVYATNSVNVHLWDIIEEESENENQRWNIILKLKDDIENDISPKKLKTGESPFVHFLNINMSWGSIHGSEKYMVMRCRASGKSHFKELNEYIEKNVDIATIQETNSESRLFPLSTAFQHFHCTKQSTSCIVRNSTGAWEQLMFHAYLPEMRGVCIIYCRHLKCIVGSIWLNHTHNVKKHAIIHILNWIYSAKPDCQRIILGMDANDSMRELRNFTFTLPNGLQIYNKASDMQTCCETDYRYFGDYVMDSQKQGQCAYMVPWSERNKQCYGDHLGLVYNTKFNVSPAVIVYDFDGVLHTCATKPDPNGQVHPLYWTPDDLVKHDCMNTSIKNDIAYYKKNGFTVHILSNNTALGTDGIRKVLSTWGIHVNNVFVVHGNKASKLKDLQANVFFDDSMNRVREVRQALPNVISVHYQTPRIKQLETSISIITYNCLYTEYAHDPPNISMFENELIKKSKYNEQNTNNFVKAKNLGWHVRYNRIMQNILACGIPDILLLQETTPTMCQDILKQFPKYMSIRSKSGNLGGIVDDGYCYTLFNTHKFGLKKQLLQTSNVNQRFVGLVLHQNITSKDVFVANVHLPASPPLNYEHVVVKPIQDMIEKEAQSIPVIIGGDFNITENPFANFKNLTSMEPTFYNDSTYKLDWLVGKKVTTIRSHVNKIGSERWPNETEGSDHTCLFAEVNLV